MTIAAIKPIVTNIFVIPPIIGRATSGLTLKAPVDREKDWHYFLVMGPLVVYVRSSSPAFQTYAGGILDSRECNTGGPFDHSLILVGRGCR
ncbi:unnamed protein product [Oppiella nova]|uniref:Uncharacterized protein n=1 Tax=Oppiella nova TaxID=334625 RepID=A0A7R9L8Z4_9ACAR|nr:unnamed protein product [Oppiella nova]CAG2160016.1 unnamed protein product [Oppiella nova]